MDLLPEVDILEGDMETLSETLYNNGMDYHIIDEDHLLKATMENGLTCGLVHADTLIVPFTEFVTVPVMRQLKAFTEAGGKVIFLKKLPVFEETGEDENVQELLRTLPFTSLPDFDALPCEILYPHSIIDKTENMLISPYELNGKRFWLAINQTEEAITVKSVGKGTVYDPEHDTWENLGESFILPGERGLFIFEED